jgi:hypothetical protein
MHLLVRQEEGNRLKNVGLSTWVHLDYGLNREICNACIRLDKTILLTLRSQYLRFIVAALYLVKPLDMHLAGSFTYGDEEEGFLAEHPAGIDHRSNICLDIFSIMQMTNFYLNTQKTI